MSTTDTTRVTREATARKKVWTPPDKLKTPQPPEGYKYRWVRHEVKGQDDRANIMDIERQGYELVRAEELPGVFETVEKGQYQGVVCQGDLMLAKIPAELAQQRDEYYSGRAERMQKAVDMEFDSSNPAPNLMPIEREHKTQVETGAHRRPVFDDQSTS